MFHIALEISMFHVAFLVSPMCHLPHPYVIILASICREVEAVVLSVQPLYPPDIAASGGPYPRSLLLPWCGRPGLQNYSVNQWNVLKCVRHLLQHSLEVQHS